eukprot:CAMPEP_0181184564 /NCGR_PEP_ID=MMETSP1096-20121128/9035_1 /TAXON_ID=156174 ORGANISM="Chrysochromulina ericina, Strain CCMP281" /NCGR_SAMPLE_ID=MMETSP1096 /ASSEMBLY_ACC=CAM_ASM_000453 /LENGTH=76 /DNA_ID=CAMNT_0023273337 /DNA_START=315 /DNA_END=545 /DNA_ORIENTATION=+
MCGANTAQKWDGMRESIAARQGLGRRHARGRCDPVGPRVGGIGGSESCCIGAAYAAQRRACLKRDLQPVMTCRTCD